MKKWLLGTLKGKLTPVYLEDFKWDCGWYWGGGYITTHNMHTHFDSCFLETIDSRGHSLGHFFDPWTRPPDYLKEKNITRIKNGACAWEPLSTFLDNAQYDSSEWWRIKDLFKQFYTLRDAAKVFQYGGHCTSDGRTDAEINKTMADKINKQIETVIIPEIRKMLDAKHRIIFKGKDHNPG